MFEAAEVGRKVSKETFDEQVPELRTELLRVQRELRHANIPVMVLIAGVEGAGKGEVVNRLNEWLDPRGMQTHAFWDETDEERERPRYWRFWRAMPPRGEIGILFGGWYQEPIEHSYFGKCSEGELEAELNRIADLERMLTEDGVLVVKFWFHLSEKDQRNRLKKLSRDDRSRWKMAPKKAQFTEHYRQFQRIAEALIRNTDTGNAPWYLIEAEDRRYRDLTVGRTLLRVIDSRLEFEQQHAKPADLDNHTTFSPPNEPDAQLTVLDHMKMDAALEQVEYKSRLKALQRELNELAWHAYQKKRSLVLVFEGVDAGGKGGAIRRFTKSIDSRLYRTISVAAPTDEEKAQHYLWRFWRNIPRAGRISIYDRSWYGRVLVERVEGFASLPEWRRAYAEINAFEEQLVESGVVLCKFWLQITQEEQLARFKAREETPYKQHKITDEDWRNREKWPDYRKAINEMVNRTSTSYSAWTLVEGNDKKYARIKVLETVRDTLKAALQGSED